MPSPDQPSHEISWCGKIVGHGNRIGNCNITDPSVAQRARIRIIWLRHRERMKTHLTGIFLLFYSLRTEGWPHIQSKSSSVSASMGLLCYSPVAWAGVATWNSDRLINIRLGCDSVFHSQRFSQTTIRPNVLQSKQNSLLKMVWAVLQTTLRGSLLDGFCKIGVHSLKS